MRNAIRLYRHTWFSSKAAKLSGSKDIFFGCRHCSGFMVIQSDWLHVALQKFNQHFAHCCFFISQDAFHFLEKLCRKNNKTTFEPIFHFNSKFARTFLIKVSLMMKMFQVYLHISQQTL